MSTTPNGQACPTDQYSRIPRWMVKDPRYHRFTRAQLLTMSAILLHATADGRSWVGTRRIAKETGLNRTTVIASVEKIIESGLLTRTRALVGDPPRWGSLYHVDRSAPADRRPGQLQPTRRPVGFCAPARSGFGGSTGQLQPTKSVRGSGKERDPLLAQCLSHQREEESESGLMCGGDDDVQPPGEEATDGDFDAWWEAYPIKLGRKLAEEAYLEALEDVDPDYLLERTQLYAEYVADGLGDRRYIPNPSTWLKAGRWDDDEEAWKTEAGRTE